jgi:hypothetical protein
MLSEPEFRPVPNAIAIWWIVPFDGHFEMHSAAAYGLCWSRPGR